MPISALMDRDKVNIPESQIGFIRFVVRPIMLIWGDIVPEAKLAMHNLAKVEEWYVRYLLNAPPNPLDTASLLKMLGKPHLHEVDSRSSPPRRVPPPLRSRALTAPTKRDADVASDGSPVDRAARYDTARTPVPAVTEVRDLISGLT